MPDWSTTHATDFSIKRLWYRVQRYRVQRNCQICEYQCVTRV